MCTEILIYKSSQIVNSEASYLKKSICFTYFPDILVCGKV